MKDAPQLMKKIMRGRFVSAIRGSMRVWLTLSLQSWPKFLLPLNMSFYIIPPGSVRNTIRIVIYSKVEDMFHRDPSSGIPGWPR